MKMLYCLVCRDVFSVREDRERACICGQSKCRYEDDSVTVTYSGPAIMLGFANSLMAGAIRDQITHQDHGLNYLPFPLDDQLKGRQFQGWVIPYGADSLNKLDDHPDWDSLKVAREGYVDTE